MNPSRFHQLLRDHSIAMARMSCGITRALYLKWARQDHGRMLAALLSELSKERA